MSRTPMFSTPNPVFSTFRDSRGRISGEGPTVRPKAEAYDGIGCLSLSHPNLPLGLEIRNDSHCAVGVSSHFTPEDLGVCRQSQIGGEFG